MDSWKMEQQVEDYASKLMSDDGPTVLEAWVSIAALSASGVIARYCLKEEGKARELARKLLDTHTFCAQFYAQNVRRTGVKQGYFLSIFALQIVKGFVNFARVSKRMRCCLLDLNDFFPALGHLLTDDFMELAEVDDVRKATHHVHQMLVTFLSFEDSKQRALDKGLIQIHASLFSRLSKILEKDGSKKDPAEFARMEAQVKEIADADRYSRDSQDALKARRVQARYLEAFKEAIGDRAERQAGTPLKKGSKAGLKSAKSSADWASGQDVDTPIVCSWELLRTRIGGGRRQTLQQVFKLFARVLLQQGAPEVALAKPQKVLQGHGVISADIVLQY
ncbi:hypothetical protein KFL_007520010 [Klebsormidium nitens]|uniref:Uncharacterized protein n=1 Tax=Klebsormidium nitens TaxID=105231 RepID=A0A1Y1IK77_KLENI|nr:hypothetical protein KFL_007520010 [Klebsormidium nitens]|eukprot:GAQ91250.1 hypothetical protein KFL_007520010 [Klebsormidium nitens]